MIGSLIIGLMARFGSEKIRGHGIPEAIEAILIGRSRIEPKVALLKPLSSAISIGTGGPFGAEGPIIMTGGALGSLFAQLFHLSSAERKTLLVAGAAAGMTAVFGTPIAAVLLAVELLLFEWKPRSFIPVTVAAVVAFAWRPLLIGSGPLFPYARRAAMPWWGLGLCVVAGLVAGAQSALLTLCFTAWKIFSAACRSIGCGGPRWAAWWSASAARSIRRCWAWAMTISAPCWRASITLGARRHFAVGQGAGLDRGAVVRHIGRRAGAAADPGRRAGRAGSPSDAVRRCRILGAVGHGRDPGRHHARAADRDSVRRRTDRQSHLLPQLFVASVAGFGFTVLVMRRSILTERIARRGLHLSREYGVDPFDVMRVSEIMAQRRSIRCLPAMTVKEAVEFFAKRQTATKAIRWWMRRAASRRWCREPMCCAGRAKAGTADETLGDLKSEMVTAFPDELTGAVADRMARDRRQPIPVIDARKRKIGGIGGAAGTSCASVDGAASKEQARRRPDFAGLDIRDHSDIRSLRNRAPAIVIV